MTEELPETMAVRPPTSASLRPATSWRHVGNFLGRSFVFCGWAVVATSQLVTAPGLDLDEAWYILSSWGQWPPADPLSGMTRYTAPFPIWLLKLADGRGGWLLLRAVGMFCNALAVWLLARWLRRRYPREVIRGWAIPVLATVPLWVIYSRSGTEPAMFGPLLGVLGVYFVTQGTPASAFIGGLAWGVGAYNHVLGAFIPISIALAWVVTYRRLPRLRWRAFGAGLLIGAGPRLIALIIFRNVPINGADTVWSLKAALRDLPSLPAALWDILGGNVVYLRYVGEERFHVYPYWLLGLLFAWPWRARPSAVPKGVRVVITSSLIMAVLITVFAPRIACNYLVVPVVALVLGFVELGAAAVLRDIRARPLVRSAGLVIAGANVIYFVGDYLLPWHTGNMPVVRFALGRRNPAESNYPFLPRERLLLALRELAPEQVLATPTLERPLRVLLAQDPIRVRLPARMEPGFRTVLIAYREGQPETERCVSGPLKEVCFSRPLDVNGQYLIYRQ